MKYKSELQNGLISDQVDMDMNSNSPFASSVFGSICIATIFVIVFVKKNICEISQAAREGLKFGWKAS